MGWLLKKVMGRNVWMCFVLTALTYIALNALEIFMPSVDSVDLYIVLDGIVEKPCLFICIDSINIHGI